MKLRNILSFLLIIVIFIGLLVFNNRVDNNLMESDYTDTDNYEKDSEFSEESSTKQLPEKKVGVLMPTRSSERWINDGINMKAKLEAVGYEVDLQFAEDVIDLQVEQIKTMIKNKVDCLVIASIDSEALVDRKSVV